MSVRLSKKHGVNASVMLCFYCGESSGVALLGQLKDDAEAPREAIFDMEPCSQCKEYMEQGVMVIVVEDGDEARAREQKQEHQRRYAGSTTLPPFIPQLRRTGYRAVLRDEALRRVLGDKAESVVASRYAIIEETAARQIGLIDRIQQAEETGE